MRKIALAALLVLAVFAGWMLFRPGHSPARHTASSRAHLPTPAVALEAEATESPSPQPAATAEPTATVLPATPAAESSANPNGPRLALIVDDCGQWLSTERGFIALDVPLTLSVLPDVHYTALVASEAAGAGKGVMLHLPMETISGMNPGPGKVTTEMTDAQIVAQVEDDLSQIPSARGVNNHEGSKASADERVMHDVMGVLAKHGGLFFIDSRTNAASVGEAVARADGVPAAARDVFLDNQTTVDYSIKQLREAEAIALRTGSAIAIGHPRPTTLEAVRAMIPEFEAKGIQFVLASELVTAH